MVVVPQWTEELRGPVSGADHLGLGSVSFAQILARLSPGINALTPHPRYHSFYTFVLDEFWARDHLPRDRRVWQEFFRAREFIYSVACNTCPHPGYEGQFGNIVGSQKTGQLADDPPDGGYLVDFDYIVERLGGYGLYYRTIMASLDLVYPTPENELPVDVPTEEGQQTAEAFRRQIAGTRYWKEFFDAQVVPAEVVREYGEAACLCRLPEAAADLGVVREFILHGGSPEHAASRRASLRMLLDLADQVPGSVDPDRFRQLIYYLAADDGAAWNPRAVEVTPERQRDVVATWRRWRIFQAREFFAFGLNALWRWLVEWGLRGDGDLRTVPEREVLQALVGALKFGALGNRLGTSLAGIEAGTPLSEAQRRLRVAAGEPEIAPVEEEGWPDRPYDIERSFSEWRLYEVIVKRGDPDEEAAACVALLLLVATRMDSPALWARDDWRYGELGGLGRLSLHWFVRRVGQHRDSGADVGALASWLVSECVIAQHLRTAASKLPENTYRFVREGGCLRFFDRARPVRFNNPRFDALSHTASGIGLVTPLVLDEHPLTAAGRRLLEQGDLEAEGADGG